MHSCFREPDVGPEDAQRTRNHSGTIEERRRDGIRSLYQFVVAHGVTAFASHPELVVQPTQVGIRSRRIGLQLARLQGRKRKNRAAAGPRSEEHTSELQSLMRISYAVFCLQKKQTQHQERPTKPHTTLQTPMTH